MKGLCWCLRTGWSGHHSNFPLSTHSPLQACTCVFDPKLIDDYITNPVPNFLTETNLLSAIYKSVESIVGIGRFTDDAYDLTVRGVEYSFSMPHMPD